MYGPTNRDQAHHSLKGLGPQSAAWKHPEPLAHVVSHVAGKLLLSTFIPLQG